MGVASRDRGSSDRWLVRNEQGQCFGPTSLATLQEWTRQGRIGPMNEVSRDGGEWVLAATIVELRMDWVAEMRPGNFYGPIHLDALRELLDEGAIKSDAPLFQRGEPCESEARETLRREADTLRTQVDVLRQQGVEQAAAVRAALAESASAAKRLLRTQSEQAATLARNKSLERELAQVRETVAQQGEQAQLMRQEALEQERDIETLRHQLAAERERLQAGAAEVAALQDERQCLSMRIEALTASALHLEEELRTQQQIVERERCAARQREAELDRDKQGAVERNTVLLEKIRELECRLEATTAKYYTMAAEGGETPSPVEEAGEVEVVVEAEAYTAYDPVLGERDNPEPKQFFRRHRARERSPAANVDAGIATNLQNKSALAELEAQALRELEMLGKDAHRFFKGKRT